MKTLIIEDDEMSALHLTKLCEKIPSLRSVIICHSALEGLQELENKQFDLVFLDIEMPEMSGMDILRNFKNLPPVILTTSKEEFALESYEHGVIDYLIKPVDLARLIKAVNKLGNNRTAPSKKEAKQKPSSNFFIRSEGKHIQIKKSDILYLETLDDYLTFYLENGEKHIVHGTLKKMENKLNSEEFLRVHRSYMVNLNKVESIEDTHLEIKKKVIPVSRSNRATLMEKVKML
ncbi:MAG: LytTR family DNA-binding domain-containing protein [Vicingaceae bacterium]